MTNTPKPEAAVLAVVAWLQPYGAAASAQDFSKHGWHECVLRSDAQLVINRLERERDAALQSRNEWIRENGRGGWIDDLRNSNAARGIELAALKSAQPADVARDAAKGEQP